jgi:hypothetical protein
MDPEFENVCVNLEQLVRGLKIDKAEGYLMGKGRKVAVA